MKDFAATLIDGRPTDALNSEIWSAAYELEDDALRLQSQMETIKERADRAIADLQVLLDYMATDDASCPGHIRVNPLGVFQSTTSEADRMCGELDAKRKALGTLLRIRKQQEAS